MTETVDQSVEELVEHIVENIQEKKGVDITIIDLRDITSVADFFVIACGTSTVHNRAIADGVKDNMKKEHGEIPWHTEGYEALKWVLLDYVNVVVHVQDEETRSRYDLEKLWEDAVLTRIENED